MTTVNDDLAFLAFATLFGLACLFVGWQARRFRDDRAAERTWKAIRREIDHSDFAGA